MVNFIMGERMEYDSIDSDNLEYSNCTKTMKLRLAGKVGFYGLQEFPRLINHRFYR
jgi:hypothetical protein